MCIMVISKSFPHAAYGICRGEPTETTKEEIKRSRTDKVPIRAPVEPQEESIWITPKENEKSF